MDKRKLLIIVPVVIVLVLFIVFGIDLARDLKTEKENRASSIEESLKESESESVRESQEEEASEAAEEHKEILSQLCTLVQEAGVQEDSSKEGEGLVFPYAIPDTGLVVEKVIPYSGHFLEDGSNDEVKDSVALILKNNGEDLETVTVRLMAEGKTLNFMASEVLKGQRVLIQERNRTGYTDETISYCSAVFQAGEEPDLHDEEIGIRDNEDNTFLVMNISDNDYSAVRVIYKNYLEDEDLYVGGITYRYTAENMSSGAIMVANSSHYVSGISKVLDVDPEE